MPITTPFTSTSDVDEAGLISNIEKWNRYGITGYVVLGSTGERVHLDEHEYLYVIDTARKRIPDKMTFIVGAGQQSTRGTIAEIKRAAQAGAEAVLVITPHYYRSAITQEALIDHYAAVADASSIPIILYSMPDLTGVKIGSETIARLSEHPNIVAVKDSSNDVATLRETVKMVAEHFAVTIGNGTVFAEALQAGACGGILAVGCVVPELCLDIYHAVQAGEIDKASALQARLTPLARTVTKTYGIGGLKAALKMAGYAGGVVRAPLKMPAEQAVQEIASRLHDAVSEPGALATGS